MASSEMYREHILDLYKNPHNFKILENATHKFHDLNPLCGDQITLYLVIKNNKIENAAFTGSGCAISVASASMLTDAVKNKTIEEIKKLSKEEILKMLNIPISPVRLKCALLCLDTLKIALER